MPQVQQLEEIPLVRGCARARLGYNPMLRLVLRGEVEGRQDERGRWFVSTESLDAYIARQSGGKAA